MLNAFTGNLSAYVFCHEDDLKAQVVAQLQFLVEDLKFWEQHKTHLTQSALTRVCVIDPNLLHLYPASQNKVLIDTTQSADVIKVYGYNFTPNAIPKLALQPTGTNATDFSNVASVITPYQINLNLNQVNFAGISNQSSLTLNWADGSQNAISLEFKTPAKLGFSNLVASPSSPIMGKDSVSFSVTITNSGETPSDPGVVVVDSGMNQEPPKKLPLAVLQPDQQLLLSFPNYFVYSTAGTYNVAVSLEDGSASPATLQLVVQSNISYVSNCVIDEPVVTKEWTPILQSDHSTCPPLHPGDRVKIVSVTGCVNTGGYGNTTKLYATPDRNSQNDKYYGMIAIPGTIPESLMTRISDFISKNPDGITVSQGQDPILLELGYVDDNYSDDGYSNLDPEPIISVSAKDPQESLFKLRITNRMPKP